MCPDAVTSGASTGTHWHWQAAAHQAANPTTRLPADRLPGDRLPRDRLLGAGLHRRSRSAAARPAARSRLSGWTVTAPDSSGWLGTTNPAIWILARHRRGVQRMLGRRSDGRHEPGPQRDLVTRSPGPARCQRPSALPPATAARPHRARAPGTAPPARHRPTTQVPSRPTSNAPASPGGPPSPPPGPPAVAISFSMSGLIPPNTRVSNCSAGNARAHGHELVPGGQAAGDQPGHSLGRAAGEGPPAPAPAVALHRVEQRLVAGVVHSADQRRGGELPGRVHARPRPPRPARCRTALPSTRVGPGDQRVTRASRPACDPAASAPGPSPRPARRPRPSSRSRPSPRTGAARRRPTAAR